MYINERDMRRHIQQTYFGQDSMAIKLSEAAAERSRLETENARLRRDLETAKAQEALLLARLAKVAQMLRSECDS